MAARGDKGAGGNSLKQYWVFGAGRAKWNSWTELYGHLKRHLSVPMAKRVASQWFHDRYGYWSGDKRNR